jgi:outer membrane protein OmpA-like peptidoglycan-associated protein
LVYKTPVLASRVREWTFEIRDESGRTIKTLAGHTKPPAYIQWDGRNQAGQSVPQNTRYQFVFSTSAQKAEVKTLPAFQPVLKFRFENGVTPLLSVRFRLKTRPLVKQWSLEIREGQSGRTVQTIAGRGELPESLLWDGRDENKKTADTRLAYQYLLTVTYPDESQLSLAGRIVPILARPVEAPSGQTEILIPGILFDFNSALLRPEMTDKIMAAAGILEELQAATRVTCEGHADEIGGVAYNQKLSLTRAQMVAQFMAKQPGVRASVIEAKGFGKLKPENQLNTEAGRERNRRVEIRLFIPKSAQ